MRLLAVVVKLVRGDDDDLCAWREEREDFSQRDLLACSLVDPFACSGADVCAGAVVHNLSVACLDLGRDISQGALETILTEFPDLAVRPGSPRPNIFVAT